MLVVLEQLAFICYTVFIKREGNMKNIAIRLEESTENRLNNLATQTGRTKTFYIKKAIEEFLEKKEDYLLGLAVLENTNEKEYSLDDVKDLLK